MAQIQQENTKKIYRGKNGQISSEEQEKMNMELGLQFPNSLLTEDIPVWDKLFRYIREMYIYNLISKESIPNILASFTTIPRENQNQFLTDLAKVIIEKQEEQAEMEFLLEMRELNEELNSILSKLDPLLQEKVLYYFEKGEQMPLEVENATRERLENIESENNIDASERLSQIFIERERFRVDDSSAREIPFRSPNAGMTSEMVAERFLNSSNTTPKAPTKIVQPKAPATVAKTAPSVPSQITTPKNLTEDNTNPYQKDTKGLSDLLK